ncbi:MAG TPA: hypothetical protein VF118_03510 [Gemmatimonadaceae bacterium]
MKRTRRRIRLSGWAALAFAAFLLAVAPTFHSGPDGGTVVEWATIAQAVVILGVGVAAVRQSLLAGAVLGLWGIYCAGVFGLAVVLVLAGREQTTMGPAWVMSTTIRVPFAVCWVIGGLAALSLYRSRARAEPAST